MLMQPVTGERLAEILEKLRVVGKPAQLGDKINRSMNVFVRHNVRPITGRAGTEPRSTERNYTAGPVRYIGGLSRRRFAGNGHPLRTHEIRPAEREVFMGANDRP